MREFLGGLRIGGQMISKAGTAKKSTNAGLPAILLLAVLIGTSGCAGLVGATGGGGNQGALTITGAQAGSATASSFSVSWTTNQTANSQVDYGTTSAYGSSTTLNTTLVTSHQITVSSLTAGTLYHFRVRSTDAANSKAAGADMTIATTGDTTPPTVSITSPAAGATLSAIVTVSATASDNIGVTSVHFNVDGANTGLAIASAPYNYSLNTNTLSNGNHVLTAVASDAAGNTATSAAVSVKVNNTTPDTTPPTVSLTAPAAGATVSGTVTVSANASDNVAVASVQFKLDGANVGTAGTTSPYNFSWDTTKTTSGTHSLTATATDTSGNSATSTPVSVTVNNAADTTPPSVPTGLAATGVSSSQVSLTWNASTDNVGVTGYNVFRGGSKVGTSTTTTYMDSGLTASTSYTYTVSAFDAAGNTSAQSASASATTLSTSGGQIPNTLGWYQIPNTQLQSVCPNYSDVNAVSGCSSIMMAWSGAVADTTRNRLVIWGGGHSDYYGNEVYALNLTANPITLTRLNEPTRFTSNSVSCNGGKYWDGKPCARHTYDLLSYSPQADVMINFGGSETPNGSFCSEDIWSLNLATLGWASKGSGNWDCNSVYSGSAYDPNSGLVFFADDHNIYTYNVSTGAMTSVGGGYSQRNSLAYSSLVVDPVHKYLFVMGGSGGGGTGGNLYRFNIANPSSIPSPTDLLGTSSGCSTWLAGTGSNGAAGGPGVAWYPIQSKIVMWNGGGSVGAYDPVANSCSTVTYPNGPGSPQVHGTYGRFSYFPALGVFALANDISQNAWTLRLDAGSGGTGGGSGPIISGVTATSISTSGAIVVWTTDVASTSQVEYGTTTGYGTTTTLNSSMVPAHSVALTGLSTNTLYHYRVHSKNSSGTESISGDAAFQTNNTVDNVPPTVSITAPANGAAVSGTVTISANATDNVAVANVQFMVDGTNVGGAHTAAPYSASWNTTTASNGTHVLTAQATDTSNNFATSTAVSVTVSNSTSTADQNYQQRCAAPGVLNCQGFDSAAIFSTTASQNGFTDGFLGSQPMTNNNRDTSVFLSGGSSLRMTWPANYNSSNCCKDYWAFFGQANQNQVFGQNSTFYIQYAFRADSNWVTKWVTDTYPKLSIIYNAVNGSCGNSSLVTVNMHALDLPEMYLSCAGTPLDTCLDGFTWNSTGCGSGEIYGQEGWTALAPFTGYQCGYNGGAWSGPNCFHFVPDTWYTLYYKVSIGIWGTPTSTVQAWIAPYGQQMQQWINTQNVSITPDNNGYNVIGLTQFMTNHGGSNLAANVWFDELIVSSQPIAAPGGQTPQ